MPKKPRQKREPFGRIRVLSSGRVQAAYTGPDLVLHKGVSTFDELVDARAWLYAERAAIQAGTWISPLRRNAPVDAATFEGYSKLWLQDRTLKPSTRNLYRGILDQHILPELGERHLVDITPIVVRAWYSTLDPDKPTRRAHAYALLRTILNTAVAEDLLPNNPCRLRGAGNSKRQHIIKPASLPELEAVTREVPERHRVMVLLAAWCALRFGELTELRRKDVDLKEGKIKVRRAVVNIKGKVVIGLPKSDAGVRDVSIPPHLFPAIKSHLETFAAWGKDGLVFPAPGNGGHLAHGSFFKTWDEARTRAGRPDLRFHDLRHTGAVLAAQSGATLAELMGRLGHSTPAMAIRYQHASEDRDMELARKLSAMAGL